MTLHRNMAGRIPCAVPPGLLTKEAPPDPLAELKTAITGHQDTVREGLTGLNARLGDLEQKMARGDLGSGGGTPPGTWGRTVVNSPELKAFVQNGARGKMRVEVERKATITTAAGSAGALIPPHRDAEVVTLPRLRLTIRALLASGDTSSNSIQAMRETVFANNAAVVPETTLKPESNIQYEAADFPVRTIAHWVPVSRQAMDDAPQLQSLVDTALRWGVAEAEERQILLGSGTGENLLGLVPAATAYDATADAAGDNMADTILKALSQGENASQLPMTGVVVNSTDWSKMIGMKGADGHYLSGGPFGTTTPTLWGRPVVDTPAMPQGDFLVLNGTQAAQIFDRQTAEILISESHADFFVRNLLVVLCEARLALVIRRQQALVYGSYPTP